MMNWFTNRTKTDPKSLDMDLQALQEGFTHFLALLDLNNQVLNLISDMEEKSRGEHLFDINYIRTRLAEIEPRVSDIIGRMVALGGSEYQGMYDRFAAIRADIAGLFVENRPIQRDRYTIPFEELSRLRAHSVGSKNAQLGEIKSRLGLPVPDGFAITTWAYKRFVDANELQARITERIKSVDFKRYEDLARVSEAIQAMIAASPVPEDLAQEIRQSQRQLAEKSGTEAFSLRSSAIGEDTLFSFAGQYRSFLNVRPEELIERYRAVLASKFTPQAIYYFLSHDLAESELAMSASCVAMIDARASGVAYTRDPVRADEDCVLVSAIYGLGKYLVEGRLTPDLFCVARGDGRVRRARIALKPVRLVMRPGGGTVEEAVPAQEQELPSLGETGLRTLSEYAMRIEEHYGAPQDIEWALARDGRLFVLQSRPLRMVPVVVPDRLPDFSKFTLLRSSGITVCPGAGCGPIVRAGSTQDLARVPKGAVLVARNPFPGLITAMGRIRALVTEVGSVASHMATLAREYQIPTLAGVEGAAELPEGTLVTVDATGCVIYAGTLPELCAARRPRHVSLDDNAILNLLRRVLAKVSPLNLVHPSDSGFAISGCRTLHDLTRFAHQRAMDEMFSSAKRTGQKKQIGTRLRTELPLDVHIIHIDQAFPSRGERRVIDEEEIDSVPMQAFWSGIRTEGWVAGVPSAGSMTTVPLQTARPMEPERGEFSESSFVILGKEYMLLSLGLGYHFTTVEAMCTSEPSKNYIRMQYKGGGASLDRRVRRLRVIVDLLSKLGFEHSGTGDFLDSSIAYLDCAGIRKTLHIMGRITMITKQLDIALSNDAIADWYTQDFIKRLQLGA